MAAHCVALLRSSKRLCGLSFSRTSRQLLPLIFRKVSLKIDVVLTSFPGFVLRCRFFVMHVIGHISAKINPRISYKCSTGTWVSVQNKRSIIFIFRRAFPFLKPHIAVITLHSIILKKEIYFRQIQEEFIYLRCLSLHSPSDQKKKKFGKLHSWNRNFLVDQREKVWCLKN